MIDWPRINTVFLDMDGTLLDLYFDNHFWLEYVPKKYAEQHGLSLPEAHDRLMGKYEAVRGTMDWYCVDYWTRQLGLDIAGLKRETSHLISVHPHVREFLGRMQATHHRVVLVTNAHRMSLMLKMEKTALEGLLDHIVCSHDFGLPKEDPEFWGRLQEKESFDPQSTLLIDDSLSVLNSARRYGIHHLLSISKPDSRKPDQHTGDFPAIASFSELLPGLP